MASATSADDRNATAEGAAATPDSLGATMLDAAVLTTACLVFLALCLYQLQLPGLYADEAFDVIPAMQLLLGHPVELQRNIGLHLFGLDLPLMSSSDYQGVTSTYLVLPFFALGGINVVSLRLMTVTVGLVGVILTFFLARAWFGRGAARLAVLLIAVSPAWVFWSRIGVYVVSQVMPIGAGTLLALTVWVRRPLARRQNGPLYAAAFLLGLGLTTKLLFIWFIVAVAITALILWGRPLWTSRHDWLRKRVWLRPAALSAFWFILGASPFLLYNLLSGGTFSLLRHTLSAPGATDHGVSNSALLRNLWTEADAFKVLLDGGYFWFQGAIRNGARAVYSNPLTPTLFVVSALGLVAMLITEHKSGRLDWDGISRRGSAALVAAFLLSVALATGLLGGTAASLLVLLVGALAGVGTLLVIRSGLRGESTWVGAAWLLLLTATIAGAVWWFLGAGRPEGMAPGAFLGFWPIDSAGAVFWASSAGLLVLLGFDNRPAPRQRVITAMLTLIGLIVAQSSVTVSGLWSTHLLMLLPMPQITIAAFAVFGGKKLATWFGSRLVVTRAATAGAAFAVALVGAVIFFDLAVARDYHRDMATTGGAATFSDAIYSLADYLDTRNPKPRVVALDWGFKRPIQLLTLDRVNPDDAYGYEEPASPATQRAIADLVASPNTLFLFHTAEAGIAYQRFGVFAAAARDQGKQPVLERTFFERDGVPVYKVYSVR
jgi:hypothetical protein